MTVFELRDATVVRGTETVFPGLSFTVASPLFKLTSTDSTPGTFFNATWTTCAQVIQSMPKMDKSACSTSACPARTASSVKASTENVFRIIDSFKRSTQS